VSTSRPCAALRVLVASLASSSACSEPPPETEPTCEDTRLFGVPNAVTGLTSEQCGPACACAGFETAVFTPERIEVLRTLTLQTPFEELSETPYGGAPPEPTPEGTVCGVVVLDEAEGRYELATFASETEASEAGAILTHHDACGRCSTLQDLAVYAEILDLTAPVRQCGVENFGDHQGTVVCLEALGFTLPCAQIWAFNTANTRDQCLSICASLLDAPYHEPDGALNACLLCDEEQSGSVFKAVAGRTRRNTGIASALCRPCEEAKPVAHGYPW
jgi:hypothetical protein